MGPYILELEAQQRWMMLQRMTLQTESSNHHPSTISAGVFFPGRLQRHALVRNRIFRREIQRINARKHP
jgi:hypothetical protein